MSELAADVDADASIRVRGGKASMLMLKTMGRPLEATLYCLELELQLSPCTYPITSSGVL